MIKIDVLIKAAEYLEQSEKSLIKLNTDFGDNNNPINKKVYRDKYIPRWYNFKYLIVLFVLTLIKISNIIVAVKKPYTIL